MVKIKISEMSGKLKGIQAINTNPLTNDFCKKMSSSGKDNIICTHCYSCSMLKAYRKNCVPAFENNSIALSTGNIDLPKFKSNDIIRFHAHGELINEKHLDNLLSIVEANPTKTFALYTKKKDMISAKFCNRSVPDNLILVYSNPIIDAPETTPPDYFHKVFNVCRDNYKDKINCGGKDCNGCRNCYDKTKENVIYEMIK
jgi:hypothetical protein